MGNCEVCNFVSNPRDLLVSTEYWQASLAPNQGYLGRCYVRLKEHKPDLSSLSMLELHDWRGVVQVLEGACRRAFGAGPFNWSCLMNNAFQDPEPDPHVHWHFRPRHAAPVDVDGVIFEDPEYGFHYDHNRTQMVDPPTQRAIFERIFDNIS